MNDRRKLAEALPPPYPLAMMICDGIWRDPSTGKRFLMGCFSVIQAPEFPCVHPVLWVHVSVTEGRGKVPIRLRLVYAADDELVWESPTEEYEFPDPRTVAEFDFGLGSLTFPRPGEYRFQFFVADQFIMERRLIAHRAPDHDEKEVEPD